MLSVLEDREALFELSAHMIHSMHSELPEEPLRMLRFHITPGDVPRLLLDQRVRCESASMMRLVEDVEVANSLESYSALLRVAARLRDKSGSFKARTHLRNIIDRSTVPGEFEAWLVSRGSSIGVVREMGEKALDQILEQHAEQEEQETHGGGFFIDANVAAVTAELGEHEHDEQEEEESEEDHLEALEASPTLPRSSPRLRSRNR